MHRTDISAEIFQLLHSVLSDIKQSGVHSTPNALCTKCSEKFVNKLLSIKPWQQTQILSSLQQIADVIINSAKECPEISELTNICSELTDKCAEISEINQS